MIKHKKYKFYTTTAVALAVTAVAVVPASAASPFSDVSEDHPHFKGISTLSKAGVVNGYDDGTFKPSQSVTRGQAAKIIVNAFELAAADSVEKLNFKDLNKSSEYYESITKLVALGVVKGYDDNTFRPNETVTRGQLAAMIARALDLNAKGTSPFTDVPEGSSYANAVTALYEAGISTGISATEYGVNNKVTRGQLATFIVNAMTTTPTVSQPTESQQSSITLEEVFNKALAKQQDVKSMKATVTMTQALEVSEGKETIKTNTSSKMTMTAVVDPIQFFIEGTMAMTEPESGEAIEMPLKMYMTAKDGMYMYEPTEGAWMKFPSDMFNTILDQAGVQVSAADQLEMLKEFAKDFTMQETDNAYILTLNADGEKFSQLIKEQVSALLPMMESGIEDEDTLAVEEEIGALFNSMSFDNVKYQLTIDKKSFDIKGIVTDMTLAMDMEGVKMKIDQKSNIIYDEFNKITTITIPQEVLNNAKELPGITEEEMDLVSTITLPIIK
ncbi:hypothetical protein AEA09_08130 [Lysinibacillus contaminans]|uniref:SLH domain-containing protein n=1 Tax=Lysinibacillus contaminans TaxID=1293441 RepID=A0ABR5K1C5_9BACI|nr:S-layer homology domain-containing protein [Lysinibacillus contaminans]KOS68521.1 hypothetical protein AEA09_08130 [Lysinibacillus contaminans]